MIAPSNQASGIKPNFTSYDNNDELLNQLPVNNGGGFGLIRSTVDLVPDYVEFGLVEALDEAKIKLAKVLP